jgi:hypothetical protein
MPGHVERRITKRLKTARRVKNSGLLPCIDEHHYMLLAAAVNKQALHLHNPVVIWATAEAVVGLLIEVSFIATFTQRFFGK